jgi:hypothetical protein
MQASGAKRETSGGLSDGFKEVWIYYLFFHKQSIKHHKRLLQKQAWKTKHGHRSRNVWRLAERPGKSCVICGINVKVKQYSCEWSFIALWPDGACGCGTSQIPLSRTIGCGSVLARSAVLGWRIANPCPLG